MTDLDRCTREIEQAESLLRAGHPDVKGLMMCLHDWRDERRLILRENGNSEITDEL